VVPLPEPHYPQPQAETQPLELPVVQLQVALQVQQVVLALETQPRQVWAQPLKQEAKALELPEMQSILP
jgi:hypothetical protein